jgi:hypothetical protein
MSTAITTHHQHRFAHPIAMAATATALVVGGATGVGLVLSQDGTSPTAPSAPAYRTDSCQVNQCMPGWSGEGNARTGEFRASQKLESSQPLKGGHTEIGQ